MKQEQFQDKVLKEYLWNNKKARPLENSGTAQ